MKHPAERCLIMANWEARTHTSEVTHPFHECIFFVDREHQGYCNGKSVGCLLHEDVVAIGAHRFTGPAAHIDSAVVLHYDGMQRERHLSKMKRLRNLGGVRQCAEGVIPFSSYCNFMNNIDSHDTLWRQTFMVQHCQTPIKCLHPFKKTLCLAGNGPSIRGKGNIVDVCDVVVRMNGWSRQEDVGTRIDVLCVSDHVCSTFPYNKMQHHSKGASQILVIVGNSVYSRIPSNSLRFAEAKSTTLDKSLAHRNKHGCRQVHSLSTTFPGCFLMFSLSWSADHFRGSRLRYFEKGPPSSDHSSSQEEEFVKNIIDTTGRVVSL